MAVAAVAIGAVAEGSIFKIGFFDPVDFFSQSLGAVVAASSVVGRPRSLAATVGIGVLGAVFVIVGAVFAFA